MDSTNLISFDQVPFKNNINLNYMPSSDEPKIDYESNILHHAKMLITLLTQIKHTPQMPNVNLLQSQIILEIRKYIKLLEDSGYQAEMIDCAVYALCAALDEAVLSTEWGTQSQWVQSSLLSQFRSETLGGERFYVLIEKLSTQARSNIEVLELMYVLLCLDFQGIYHDQNIKKRDAIRNNLHHLILRNKNKYIKRLSDHAVDYDLLKTNQKQKSNLKKLFYTVLILIGVFYIVYSYLFYNENKAINEYLIKSNHESPITVYSQLINRNLFHQNKGMS